MVPSIANNLVGIKPMKCISVIHTIRTNTDNRGPKLFSLLVVNIGHVKDQPAEKIKSSLDEKYLQGLSD